MLKYGNIIVEQPPEFNFVANSRKPFSTHANLKRYVVEDFKYEMCVLCTTLYSCVFVSLWGKFEWDSMIFQMCSIHIDFHEMMEALTVLKN